MALGGIGAGVGAGIPFELIGGATKSAGSGADAASKAAEESAGTGSFAGVLKSKLTELNTSQTEAGKATEDMATGRVDDVAQTMLRIEQANVELQMATQMRNKVLEAYQEVLRMQM